MLLRVVVLVSLLFSSPCLVPIRSLDRKDVSSIRLTAIGKYGVIRKERKNVRSHLHTGIDIKRPGSEYDHEPIFPIVKGKVISMRDDGPYAQLIIEHELGGKEFWALYEHIAGITVKVGDEVDPAKPIARFMNKKELDNYGWQFDHFHLEILKIKPFSIKPDKMHPQRFYGAFTLICYR